MRARARADRGPVLHRRREGAARHHRGPARSAAVPAAAGGRRLDLPADQGRSGRHLARGRPRRLLRLRLGVGESHLHAWDPEDRRDRARALPLGLAGLVSGPHRPHPREGARRRKRRPRRAAVLSGRADGQGLPPHAVQPPRQADDAQRQRLRFRPGREALDARHPQERNRLCRAHHHGRAPSARTDGATAASQRPSRLGEELSSRSAAWGWRRPAPRGSSRARPRATRRRP